MAITSGDDSADDVPISLQDFEKPVFALDKYVPAPLRGKGPDGTDRLSASALEQALADLGRLGSRLTLLHQQAAEGCAKLRREVEDRYPSTWQGIESLAQGWAGTRDLATQASGKTATLSQVAVLHGNRLKAAQAERERAITSIRRLNHLQMFAHASSLESLPALFHDENRAGEAGATARALLEIVREVVSAMRSAGDVRRQPPPLGSIEAALHRLEEFCGRLDTRIVARFDEALARADYATMASCSRTMVEARAPGDSVAAAERPLVQRYVSTRAMFTEAGQDALPAPEDEGDVPGARVGRGQVRASVGALDENGTPLDAPSARRRVLSSLRILFKSLLQSVIKETVIAEQAFQSPQAAMTSLLTRVFEQRVSGAVDAAFAAYDAAIGGGARARPASREGLLRERLLLLAETTRRVWELAADSKDVIFGGAGTPLLVAELAESALAQRTDGYLADELAWLAAVFDKESRREAAEAGRKAGGPPADASGISLPAFLRLLAAHREAFERAGGDMHLGPGLVDTLVALYGGDRDAEGEERVGVDAADAADADSGFDPELDDGDEIFESTSQSPPRTASLLEQVETMLIQRLRASARHQELEGATATLGTLSAAVELLWEHHARSLLPLLPPRGAAAGACTAGLRALQRRLDAAAEQLLRGATARSLAAVERRLRAQQDPADFLASAASADLDRPTGACREAAGGLAALLRVARARLHGANAAALATAIAAGALTLLRSHAARLRFTPIGALVWRRDLQAYEACLLTGLAGGDEALARAAEAVRAAMREMREQVSALLVVPEALPGVLASLPDRQAALQTLRLRSDFDTATVDGKPLASLLAAGPPEDGLEPR